MRDSKSLRAWAELPGGVVFVKHFEHGPDLVECDHADEHRYERLGGVLACRVCHGDEFTTSEFSRPVKILVRLDGKLREMPAQETLF